VSGVTKQPGDHVRSTFLVAQLCRQNPTPPTGRHRQHQAMRKAVTGRSTIVLMEDDTTMVSLHTYEFDIFICIAIIVLMATVCYFVLAFLHR
jgi:hypothetical protein